VQGRLRNEPLKVTVNTECAHCKKPMEIVIDSDLDFTVSEQGCEPIVFVPSVDLFKIEEESIINAF